MKSGSSRASPSGKKRKSIASDPARGERLAPNKEFRSLKNELTALKRQLQEAQERRQSLSEDLHAILYNNDVATVFLDGDLRIRFFTPAIKRIFNVIPGDVGRPLADLHPLVVDSELTADARAVLESSTAIEREIGGEGIGRYRRRIGPFRDKEGGANGVVITFFDITQERKAAEKTEAARGNADPTRAARSRFLTAACHDLRQPLQTLALLHGLLTKKLQGTEAEKFVAKQGEALAALSGMLDTLSDIGHLEAEFRRGDKIVFPIDDVLHQLREQFTDQAEAQGVELHLVSSSLAVESEPRLLELILRNLLSTALRPMRSGKILVGCRRRGDILRIELWNRDVNAAGKESPERDRNDKDPALDLSIVARLGRLLDHRVDVHGRQDKGSIFSVEIKLSRAGAVSRSFAPPPLKTAVIVPEYRTGLIMTVEGDAALRDLLDRLLRGEGHRTITAPDAKTALEVMTPETTRPDLLLVDEHLPNGTDGIQVAERVREKFGRDIPVIVLTENGAGEISHACALQNAVPFSKPIKAKELMRTLQALLPMSCSPALSPSSAAKPRMTARSRSSVVSVVDDDRQARDSIRMVLEEEGLTVEDYPSCEAFLDAYRPNNYDCLLIDAYLPGMDGLTLMKHLGDAGRRLPTVMITGHSDVSIAVQAMKAGASDFIEKPVKRTELLAAVARALEHAHNLNNLLAQQEIAAKHLAGLTPRQREIMERVLAGQSSKIIAAELGISQRTVENHRASIMKRTGSKSLPALARLAMAAATA
jgi:two-component system CheB/CheR fusion protein